MERIDFHNVVIAPLLGLVWMAVAAAMVGVGHPPSSSACWIATAVCALVLSGRVLMHGTDLLRAKASDATDYILVNGGFVVVVSIVFGHGGGQLALLKS